MRLAEDEELVLDLRPHPKALLLPVLALLGVLAATGFGLARVDVGWGRALVGVLAVLLLVRLSLVPWLRWRATRFVLTDQRISLRSGVLRRTGRDVPLARVDDVTFSQSLLQRVQGCGTLRVDAGEGGVEVDDVRDVEAVQREVYRWLSA